MNGHGLKLAPEFGPVVEALASAPKIPDGTVEDARAMWEAFLVGDPDEMHEITDLSIPGAEGPIAARLYRPIPDPQGVVLFLHGGGWALGSIVSHDIAVRALAKRSGWAFLAIEYRLAPETLFPGGLEDCFAALCWLDSKKGRYSLANRPLAIMGDSAGGNLAAALAILARDRRGPVIDAQILIYPVVDGARNSPSYTERGTGGLLSSADMAWFWDLYAPGDAALSPLASPLKQRDLSRLPTALVVTAEFDPLRDEGQAYAAALGEAGTAVDQLHYSDLPHGFLTFGGISPASDQAITEIAKHVASINRVESKL